MLARSAKSKVRRSPKRASYERDDLYRIVDDLLMAHVCFVDQGEPVSIPMLCWRVDDDLYLHGSRGSRLMKQLCSGTSVCLSFAELNAWVMAKSAFHHSANYRSAVVFGQFEEVLEEGLQNDIYQSFIEQLEPGRWQQVRQPNQQELKATTLLKMPIIEASVKVREGGPNDDLEDMALPVWVGELPLNKHWGEPKIY